MKKLLTFLCLITVVWTVSAHEHIEIGEDAGASSRLAFDDNPSQIATYFPLGEKPSFEPGLANFPGGIFASELSFSSAGDVLAVPSPSLIRVEVLAVSGPAGGSFSFWEAGASTPTFTRTSGWSASGGNQPSFPVSEDNTGWGHLHGRVFTMSRAGIYDVTLRAVDAMGNYIQSSTIVVRFTAIEPPQLAISKQGAQIELTFTSRLGLIYDVQSSTTLNAAEWTTIGEPLEGDGGPLSFTDPVGGRPRVFYRLVEYR